MAEVLATCWTHSGGSVPYPGRDLSPLSIRTRAAAVASTGYTGIGMSLADLRRELTLISLADLASMLDDLGLVHRELEFLDDWWTDGERRKQSDEDRRFLLSAAESLGASHVKIGAHVSKDGGPLPKLDVDRLAGPLHELARDADSHGTSLALEYLPMSDVSTVAEGVRVVEAADHPMAGLCVDIWHTERSGSPLADVAAIPSGKIRCVELSDARPEVVGTLFDDTINNRVLPGLGTFDIAGFISAVRGAGFTGPWGVEIISEMERRRPIENALRDAHDATRPYLESWAD